MSPRITLSTTPLRLVVLGGLAAAALGSSAGAALRLEPAERFDPAAPQQIIADEGELSTLERLGDGWPGRRHG